MPKIVQQRPNSQPRPAPVDENDVLAEAIPIGDLKNEYIKMLIFGANRTGKTTIATQFPKPLLLISMEPNRTGGALSVTKVPGVKYIRIDNSEKLMRLAAQLKATDGGVCDLPGYQGKRYATHVLDSATSLQDIHLRELLCLTELPEQLGWGTVPEDVYRQRSEKTKETLRPFLNLPANTVVISKEKDHAKPVERSNRLTKKPTTESLLAADLGGATAWWLHDACDFVGRMYVEKEVKMSKIVVNGEEQEVEEETGKTVHRMMIKLIHHNSGLVYAGFRSASPEAVPDYIENATAEKIMRVIRGEWKPGIDK